MAGGGGGGGAHVDVENVEYILMLIFPCVACRI